MRLINKKRTINRKKQHRNNLFYTFLKIVMTFLIFSLILVLLFLGVPRLISQIQAASRVYKIETVPSKKVAIVFGAGLEKDGTPSPVLMDRVATAAELYHQGKVVKLLFSGDNRFIYYNEPGSMHDFAVNLGVPEDAIVLDYAGRRTYDTCYRAKEIFGITEAILVTQSYHLPRALLICNNLDLSAIGVSADRRTYRQPSMLIWNLRELPATLIAMVDTWITHPLPVLGEREPIFQDET